MGKSGDIAATSDDSGAIRVWSVDSLAPMLVIEGGPKAIRTLAIDEVGGILAGGDTEGRVRLWRIRDGSGWPMIGAGRVYVADGDRRVLRGYGSR